jgi:hypothetical protein
MSQPDDQVGRLLFEREDFAGGLGEPAPVVHARNLTAFQQLSTPVRPPARR